MQGSINFDGSLVGNITGGGGGGGDTVVITPVVTSGTKIADVSVNGVEKDLYCPTPPTPPQINITPVQESGTKIADVSVNGVEKDLYCPTPTAVSVTQVQQSGTKIATIGVNGVNTDIYTPEGGGSDVEITPVVTSGTKIADVSVGGVEKDLYTPDYGADITEIKQSLSDFETLEKTASGEIATFDDGSDLPMPSLKVSIEPVQSGSGDPSPTNIRPISGWDEVNVTRTRKNLWDRDNIRRGVYTNSDGTTQSASASTNFSSQFIKIKPNTIYSITMFGESYENGSLFGVYYDEYKNGIKQTTNIQNLISNNSKTFTTPLNAHYIVFTGYRGAGTDIFTTANTVVCEGTPTTYEPYNGTTYTIDLDGTRYGGTLDVVSGLLTITDGYIASYNSETLPSTWISDRDVYAEGTTPTVGAEVIYKLATPQTIQLTPTQVKSLLGDNNVWADTGNIELTYLTNNPLTQTVYDMVKILVEQST